MLGMETMALPEGSGQTQLLASDPSASDSLVLRDATLS